jgi:putative nucleotidyltransferase with HDIG domain
MSILIPIGLVAWLAFVVVVLSVLKAAARADDATARHARELRDGPLPASEVLRAAELPGQGRRRQLALAEAATLALVAVLAVDTSRAADWEPVALTGLLAALAIAGDLRTFRSRRFRISASFPAIVLAMALLGPAPAVAIGVACALVDAVLTRPRIDQLTSNLLAYAAPPLAGALLLDAASMLPGHGEELGPALAVMGVYLLASALNFVLVAGHTAILGRGGLGALVRSELRPVLPWEMGAAAVSGAAVYVYGLRGGAGLAVFAIAGIALQWLLRAVMESERRGTVIERQAEELGIHGQGMVSLVLRLMELRDPASARHAAAVAHHARALARAAGLSEHEQEVVHAAGLLHDIGRQAFPDALLVRDREVDERGLRAIRAHPVMGARLLRDVPGMWEVADAVETHHERPDGTGYPHGLAGNRIPRTGRIVAIAEVYDVLTAEDSYRGTHGHAWAAAEMRRVAGTQLDARLVETFLTTVPQGLRRPSLAEELPLLRRARTLFGARPAAG